MHLPVSALGLSLALALAAPVAARAAGCGTIERLGRLNEIAGTLLSDPSTRNAIVLRRAIEEATRFDVAADGDAKTRQMTQDHLGFLTALSRATPQARFAARTRLAEMSETLKEREGALDCPPARMSGNAPEPSAEAGEGGGEGSGEGSEARKRRSTSQKAGLTMIGAGVFAVPLLVAPAVYELLRRRRARSSARHPVRYETQIRFGEEEFSCMVIDVSEGGACIVCAQPLPRTKEAGLTLLRETKAATVRWRHEHLVGLAFEAPLSEEAVAELREW